MYLVKQPQVVCTIKLWYQLFFRGHFRVGVYCMASHEKMEYVYIIDSIFVNTQSILKILAPKRNVFNV